MHILCFVCALIQSELLTILILIEKEKKIVFLVRFLLRCYLIFATDLQLVMLCLQFRMCSLFEKLNLLDVPPLLLSTAYFLYFCQVRCCLPLCDTAVAGWILWNMITLFVELSMCLTPFELWTLWVDDLSFPHDVKKNRKWLKPFFADSFSNIVCSAKQDESNISVFYPFYYYICSIVP